MNMKLYTPDGVNLTRLTELFLVVPIGATGAPGTYVLSWGFGGPNALQTTPLVRTGAGVYTVQLVEPVIGGIIWYSANTIQTTVNGTTDGLFGIITAQTVATNGQFTLTMYNNATAATEIRNGATLLLSIGVKNNANYP